MIRTLINLLPPAQRRHITPYLALTALSIALRAAAALALIPLISALFSSQPGDAWRPLAMIAIATALGWGCDSAAARHAYAVGFVLLDHAQHTVAERITTIRLRWLTGDNLATTRQAVAATGPELVGLIAYLVTPLLNALILPAAIGIGLLWFSPTLGAAALAFLPLLLGALALSMRLARSADAAADRAHAQLSERLLEFARTQQALRSARRVDTESSHVGQALAARTHAMSRLLAYRAPEQLVFTLLTQLALIALGALAVSRAVTGEVSPAAAIALIVVIVRFLEPLALVADITAGLQLTTNALRTIHTVLAAPREHPGTATPTLSTAPQIEVADVTFGYDATRERPVLDGLNLTFQPGTTTAIVGPSGSGKSTLLFLLAGLHQPTSGSIRIQGTDLAELTPAARRALIAVIFQDPYLFDGTLLDNISIGNPHATGEQIERATALARVDAVAAQLTDGMATMVGDGGTLLSGGQRQRVSIARALLSCAPVLLVDEATSALDTENERAVAAALSSETTPRTRIIVAHRLSSIRQADRVIFFDAGRVIEDGSIEDLLALDGRFAAYWRQQQAASAWRVR